MKTLLLYTVLSFLFLTGCTNNKTEKTSTSKEIISLIDNPSETNSQTPRLFSNGKELYMSWVSYKDSLDHLKYSVFTNDNWSTPETIISGNDWFTNWADFPTISENEGSLLTSFLQKSADGAYTYDIKLNYKHRDSSSWKKDFILHTDGAKAEHGFVSIIPIYGVDEFFVTWLDGRYTEAAIGIDHSNKNHGTEGAMTLRGARIDTFGNVIHSSQLDNRICDCCQTSAAMTANGPIVVYRDRSEDEIRDISIVRWEEHTTWSQPKSIYNDTWRIAGCPVNGPAVDALGNNVAVAWFTAVNDIAKVQLIFSIDGGENFGSAIHINTQETLGRVDVIMLNETEALISWLELDDQDVAYVQAMKVSSSGQKSNKITLIETSGSRASGYPQIELLNGSLYAAMTLIEADKSPSIKTLSVPLRTFEF